jgi:23S rRNA (uracil1939-C5)-methyltransferase
VAHVDGKAVFVAGALPGEEVELVYTAVRRDYAEARLNRIVSASPHRVEPLCPWSATCGGCCLQHLALPQQTRLKQELLLGQLRRLGGVEAETLLPPLTGAPWGYRRKARLGVKFVSKKGRVLVGFREKASNLVAAIDACAVLHPSVGQRLGELSGVLGSLSIKDRVPQVEVAVGDERPALVVRMLAEPSAEDLDRLKRFGAEFDFAIYIQRGGPESLRLLHPDQAVRLDYRLPAHRLQFEFAPTEFTQINADVNRAMVDRVLDLLQLRPEHEVLDLYCGLGNFTLPIARLARHVIGVEGDQGLVERARGNAQANGIANVAFHVGNLLQVQDGARWVERRFDRVLLDPPRAGAQDVLRYVPRWRAERIVYVSCNPATLARDAGILVREFAYRLVAAGIIDMFPHTAHVESVAVFER